MSQMDLDLECVEEVSPESDAALLLPRTKTSSGRIRRWLQSFAGMTLVGLIVFAIGGAGGKGVEPTPLPASELSSLQQKHELVAAAGDLTCYTDAPGGTLIPYKSERKHHQNGIVCAKYIYNGKLIHAPVEGACDVLKQLPSVYRNLVCCTTNLCNGDQDTTTIPGIVPTSSGEQAMALSRTSKEAEVAMPSTVPASSGDLTCYTDAPGSALIPYKSDQNGIVCAKYVYNGKLTHVPVASTCKVLKQSPSVYRNLVCCTTNLCNGD